MRKTLPATTKRPWTGLATLCVAASVVTAIPAAHADRCSEDEAGNWSCTYSYRVQWYRCNGLLFGRGVRWQVPEGSPPAAGWPVAFFYNGTTPADTNPFVQDSGAPFGAGFSPQILHELLDDPSGSGVKYAVMAPEPPQAGILVEFWNTNSVFPYTVSCDYDFFPDLFSEIKNGRYGPAGRFDMNRRYAYGISSGGYNTSRMAVTFNDRRKWFQSCDEWCNEDTWKALAIISASYATCAGALCTVPDLPGNHPPTKFWHGTGDAIVPLWTAEAYHDALSADEVPVDFHLHGGGHELNATQLGPTGVKAWFDLF